MICIAHELQLLSMYVPCWFRCIISYGRVFKTSILGRYTIFMTGREASRILLSGKDGAVRLNLSYAGKQVLGPSSLLTTSGEEHKRLRRLIGEPLSIESLKKNFQVISDRAAKTLEGWSGRTVFVLEEASTVSLKSFFFFFLFSCLYE